MCQAIPLNAYILLVFLAYSIVMFSYTDGEMWFHMKYPSIVEGVLAASAPLLELVPTLKSLLKVINMTINQG